MRCALGDVGEGAGGWTAEAGPHGEWDAAGAEGANNEPPHRGHHDRCRSRTFQRVPHCEHTWIIRPA
ncbi:hypothetical protein MFTT_58790 [Mycolicibacterium fortuitum subsp. fortuitum]|nr:hypothetical protein MFTT_58790 [Mycolicibacterium fortuitum subsp. fortuitum]